MYLGGPAKKVGWTSLIVWNREPWIGNGMEWNEMDFNVQINSKCNCVTFIYLEGIRLSKAHSGTTVYCKVNVHQLQMKTGASILHVSGWFNK